MILLIISLRYKSIASIFIILQLISVLGSFLIGTRFHVEPEVKIFGAITSAVFLTFTILPWFKFNGITDIYYKRKNKLKRLTYFLLLLSIIPFITFSITSVIVITVIENINEFKYTDSGEATTEFFYTMLPFNVKLLIFSNYLFNISYFLIPLHFFYLSKKRYVLSFFCFLFSLNIVLYGLTYFSRAMITHYLLIYLTLLILLYNTFSRKIKKVVKVFSIFMLIISSAYFVNISQDRFSENTYYASKIPSDAIVKDPVLYSYFSYLSQWHSNSVYLIKEYNFNTFNGFISLQPVLQILSRYGLVNYDYNTYETLRKILWPKHYANFNGLTAYSIYDYGIFLTLLLSGIYYIRVIFYKPINNKIPLVRLFPIVLLIQLPLFAIFYSAVSAIILPFLFMIPIYLYCRVTL